MRHVVAQAGWDEGVRAQYLSQCTYLLEALRGDERWLVPESLLQLRAEVGMPFEKGDPLPGSGGGGGSGGPATMYRLSLPAGGGAAGEVETVVVSYAPVDQRKANGEHACSAIALELARWCLEQGQGQVEVAAERGHGRAGVAGGCMDGETMARVIEEGSALWRRLRAEREQQAAAAASAGGPGSPLNHSPSNHTAAAAAIVAGDDFGLEEMMEVGDFGARLRQASYSAVLLAPVPPGPSPSPSPSGHRGHRLSSSGGSWLSPRPGAGGVRWSLTGSTAAAAMGPSPRRHRAPPPGSAACLHHFPDFMSGLGPGVYVLGCHSHFSTLWVRGDAPAGPGPGGHAGAAAHSTQHGAQHGTVHSVQLLDSLGFSLAPDCPWAFTAHFPGLAEFVSFFCRRHQQASDHAEGLTDLSALTNATLVEVHRMELA